jgi:hypothetical protein
LLLIVLDSRFVTLKEAALFRAFPGSRKFRPLAWTDGAGNYWFLEDTGGRVGHRVNIAGVDISGCETLPLEAVRD